MSSRDCIRAGAPGRPPTASPRDHLMVPFVISARDVNRQTAVTGTGSWGNRCQTKRAAPAPASGSTGWAGSGVVPFHCSDAYGISEQQVEVEVAAALLAAVPELVKEWRVALTGRGGGVSALGQTAEGAC